jgi:hypothetical protein
MKEVKEAREKKDTKRKQLQNCRTLDKITQDIEIDGRIEFREVKN